VRQRTDGAEHGSLRLSGVAPQLKRGPLGGSGISHMRRLSWTLVFAATALRAQQTPETRFWATVAPRLAVVRDLPSKRDALTSFLSEELHRVNQRLVFELGTAHDSVNELIISADGLHELIPTVEGLVRAAPSIPGWRIIAFRPRTGTRFSVKFDGYSLRPDQVWFRAEPDRSKTGLWIYIPDAEGPRRESATGAAFILLDMAIGELDVMTKVGFIEFRPLPPRPIEGGLHQLKDLPEVIDGHR